MPYTIPPPNPEKDDDVLQLLKEKNITQFLGGGAESWVYVLDENHIMRISKSRFNPDNKEDLSPLDYAIKRKAFYDQLNLFKFLFQLPKIDSVNSHGNVIYTIEKRISGISLHEVFKENPEARALILKNYYNAVKELSVIEMPGQEFGVVLTPDKTLPYCTKSSWAEYVYTTILQVTIEKSKELADAGINISEDILAQMKLKIQSCLSTMKRHSLVHGDIYPPNLMMDSKTFKVTGIIDFSDLTVIGDHRLDLASAFLQTEFLDPCSKEYTAGIIKIIQKEFGDDLNEIINIYRLYYSFLFLREWGLNNLKHLEEILKTKALWSPFLEVPLANMQRKFAFNLFQPKTNPSLDLLTSAHLGVAANAKSLAKHSQKSLIPS